MGLVISTHGYDMVKSRFGQDIDAEKQCWKLSNSLHTMESSEISMY